jgi:UDP-N-acetyl-D-glucosamine/UDP-N-acetyl-D-galactosamine dehydrogenase
VVGFDINQERVDLMKKKIDPSNELESSVFDNCDIYFTADINDLKDCTFSLLLFQLQLMIQIYQI